MGDDVQLLLDTETVIQVSEREVDRRGEVRNDWSRLRIVVNKNSVTKAHERIMRLKRRANWLEARVAIGQDDERDLSLDKAELSALRWAVKILEERFGETPEPVDR